MSRSNGRSVATTTGKSSATEETYVGRGLKDNPRIIHTGMSGYDFIVRKIDMFYNRQSGSYVADTEAVRRDYKRNSSRYDLPINLNYTSSGNFVKHSSDVSTTITFVRVKKNKEYVVRSTAKEVKKTFRYGSEDDLRDQIMDFLSEKNADYDPYLQYTEADDNSTEWWIKDALEYATEYERRRI
jgi:hypothetical protein